MLQCTTHKRFFRFLFVCLILLILHAASAEEVLPNVTITCRPESIVGPSEITLSFSIDNQTGNDCENLYISTADGLTSEPLGSLSDGENASFTRRHTVTEQELEDGKISYIFSYDDPAEPERKVNFIVETAILRAQSHAECEFTRRFSSNSVISGGTVAILYTVRNTGNVPVESLRVSDSAGDFSGRIETLNVGESRSLINRVTLTQPIISDAQLTFESDGNADTIQPEPLEIGISSARLSTVLRIEDDPDDPYARIGVLIINNTGDVGYSNMMVTDTLTDAIIAEGLSLNAGESRTVTCTFSYRDGQNICWRVTADASDGTKPDVLANAVQQIAAREAEPAVISFNVETLTPKLKRSGSARFQLTIKNSGTTTVRDLHISESGSGEIADFAFIAPEGVITKEFSLSADGKTDFVFSLEYLDESDALTTLNTSPVKVEISADGVMPEDIVETTAAFSESPILIGGSYAFTILMVIGIVLLITLTIIWIVLAHRARIRKQVRIALQKQNKGRK